MVAQTISLSIMLVAILAGIFLNNHGLRELKADLRKDLDGVKKDIERLDRKIDNLRIEFDRKTDSIQAYLRQFYHLTGKLEARLDAVEKRVA